MKLMNAGVSAELPTIRLTVLAFVIVASLCGCRDAHVTSLYKNVRYTNASLTIADFEPTIQRKYRRSDAETRAMRQAIRAGIMDVMPNLILQHSTIDSVFIDSLTDASLWPNYIVNKNLLGNIELEIPRLTQRLAFKNTAPEFVLFFEQCRLFFEEAKCSATASGEDCDVSVSRSPPGFVLRSDYILWDNRNQMVVSFGTSCGRMPIKELDLYLMPDRIWSRLTAGIVRTIFRNGPFSLSTGQVETHRNE